MFHTHSDRDDCQNSGEWKDKSSSIQKTFTIQVFNAPIATLKMLVAGVHQSRTERLAHCWTEASELCRKFCYHPDASSRARRDSIFAFGSAIRS